MSERQGAAEKEAMNLAGKRVLVTGGMGFIGSNLAHACLGLGAQVTVYDCLDPRSGGNLRNIEDIRSRIRVVYHDILSFDEVSQEVVDQDIVFNCAASTSHPFSMKEPWIDMDVNSRGAINLLEALRRFNVKARLIHLGTSTQLGPLKYRPADEEHPEFPPDIYSANKTVSEKYVLIYARAYGLRATVIRLSNVFGPRASIHSPEFTFNNYFIGLALQDKDITVYGDGKQLRNVLYVDDAVEALILAAKDDGIVGETLFAVGDEHYSVAHIAETTARVIGRGRARFVPWPAERKAIDTGDAVLSNKKIKARLGWAPRTGLEEGLRRAKAYFEPCLADYLR
ncbi:MAG TPA: GDP-mannose 4,6-dehydratase [Candidatus Brocadiia bacterium]|nr:GDP-mannose 4,6-dehydratase [Candidatus Brocadiia bacterium]